ncbi:hypothetical protein BFW38_06435 [Terasakiispira papahanaumokuakeensis]|uniref:Mu-like prophage FluMu N-terminal domain-containing protein n=1 Tax=Terasakiispira papahanaumokuakeensis TaxID=197479 RepID=A0A1E2V8N0_9GAMM|nr:hypothetical protein [Terasakiispira papahanaumokuakeensis]ODC03232.1 hypothetical protein BFW38_06435 [Terasakiispira papahanaumokuakeensis]
MAARKSASTHQPQDDQAPEDQVLGDQPAEAKAQDDQKTTAPPEIRGLWIEAVSEQGRYRAGIHWSREGQGIALDGLPESQIQALQSDPMLKVKEVTFSDEATFSDEDNGVVTFDQHLVERSESSS